MTNTFIVIGSVDEDVVEVANCLQLKEGEDSSEDNHHDETDKTLRLDSKSSEEGPFGSKTKKKN